MRALITGATGYLGSAMLEQAPDGVDILAMGHTRAAPGLAVDITDYNALAASVEAHAPDVIIHLAAMSRVPEADANPQLAMDVNAVGSANVARVSAGLGIRLIAMSTDNIFDGMAPPYREDSPPSPLGPYGRSKLAAERAIFDTHPNPLVLRTTLLVGADRASRSPFSVYVLNRAGAGRPVELYENERRNFYPVTMAAAAVWEAAARPELDGVYHLGALTSATRYQFGRALLDATGADPALAVGVAGPPDRPADLTLDVSKAQSAFSTRMPTMEEAIAETLRDMG